MLRITLSTDSWLLTHIWYSAFGYICSISPPPRKPFTCHNFLSILTVSYQTKNEFLTLSASLLLSSSILLLFLCRCWYLLVLFDIVCSLLWNCMTIWNDQDFSILEWLLFPGARRLRAWGERCSVWRLHDAHHSLLLLPTSDRGTAWSGDCLSQPICGYAK